MLVTGATQSAFKPQRLWATLIVLSLPLALTGCPDVLGYIEEALDSDNDGIPDDEDNCPFVYNPNQNDRLGDGIGDACRPVPRAHDRDNDGIADDEDNCPNTPNPDQADLNGDGIGDACDPDVDGDGVAKDDDNCPLVYNPDQSDLDGDDIGDACDPDLELDCGHDKFMRPLLEPTAVASRSINALCILCSVTDVPQLVHANLDALTRMTIPVGVLGGASVRATLQPSEPLIPAERIIAVRIASSDTPSSASLQTLTIETLRNGTVQESFDRASFSMIPSASAPHAFLLVAKTSIPADAIQLSSTSLVTSLRTIDIRAMCVGQDTTGPVKA